MIKTAFLSTFWANMLHSAFGSKKNQTSHLSAESPHLADFLETALEATPGGMLVVDHGGRAICCNQRFLTLWQQDESLMHLSAHERIQRMAECTTDPEAFSRGVEQTHQTGQGDRRDVIHLRDGRILEQSSCPQRIRGNMIGRVWNYHDVTEYQRTESALREDLHVARQMAGELRSMMTDLEKSARSAQFLSQMGLMLQFCNTENDVYQVLAEFAPRLFPDGAGGLAMINHSGNCVDVVTAWGDLPVSAYEAHIEACCAFRCKQIHLDRIHRRQSACQHWSLETQQGYLCIPLVVQGNVLGVLRLQMLPEISHTQESGSSPQNTSRKELALKVVEQLVAALANLRLRAELQEQAMHDPLTGVFNRRYLDDTLRTACRHSWSLSVIMLDIDHFKSYNDSYGHQAGDALLKSLASFLQNTVRVGDVVCRYGGEEFMLILPNTSIEDAYRRAEQIRTAVKELEVLYCEYRLPSVTLSSGVAEFLPDIDMNAEFLMQRVDNALYQAKRGGRDRTEYASHGLD